LTGFEVRADAVVHPGLDTCLPGEPDDRAVCRRYNPRIPRRLHMKAIISVVGSDKVGIIAKVSNFLADRGINIDDISQTVLEGNFVMMMMVDLSGSSEQVGPLKAELELLGDSLGVSIAMMHERVFGAMHRI
jgi:ACT domain-containing protein